MAAVVPDRARSGRSHDGGTVWDNAKTFPILSCDIFDTAIRRILARPEDVLLAAGARMRHEGLIACEPDAFAVYRLTAERTARARAEASGYDEVLIAEIYAELRATGIVSDPIRAARVEFEAECAVCRPIESVQTALMARTGRLVFASDSVLPAAWLAELLLSCGYGEGCEVFASSDLRRSKHTGRLFPAMLEALGRAPADVLHIGDNPVSDVTRPRTHGIAARYLRRPRPEAELDASRHYAVRLADSRQRAMAAERSRAMTDRAMTDRAMTNRAMTNHAVTDQAEADGRALAVLAAPLLIGFTLFILAEARRRKVNRIYFLARDGHLPLMILQRLLARRDEAAGFELHYLHVSRHAVLNDPEAPAHLEQAGFSRPGRRMIVDVGWRGSIQSALAGRTGLPDADLIGCYLGLWADALRPGLNPDNAVGYLFAFGHPAPVAACVREAYILLEMIFSAPHGTLLRYQRAEDGTIHPVHRVEMGPEAVIRRAVFAAMEAACVEMFDALDAILGGCWPEEIDARSALAPVESLLTRPTHAEFGLVNRVPFIESDDGRLLPAVNPLPLHEALRDPLRALRRLNNAPWRAGAVRAALPWPVPGMSYEVLNDRAMRVLRWGERIRGIFGRTK